MRLAITGGAWRNSAIVLTASQPRGGLIRVVAASIQRTLADDEMNEYRRPFRASGQDRLPTLVWPRQIPIGGEPADVNEIVESYSRWLARSELPKLFINADPGALLTGRPRELCRTWPHQTEVTIAGKHFVQEDSPNQIGQAIHQFVQDNRPRDDIEIVPSRRENR